VNDGTGDRTGSRARNGEAFTKTSRVQFYEPTAGMGALTRPESRGNVRTTDAASRDYPVIANRGWNMKNGKKEKIPAIELFVEAEQKNFLRRTKYQLQYHWAVAK